MPFQLPKGWAWIRQSNLCWLDNGEKSESGQLPYLEARVIRENKPDKFLNFGVVVDSKVKLILVDGENSGEVFTPPFKGYMGSTFKILGVSNQIDFEYLLLIFKLNLDLYRNSKTGAAIPHLNKKIFKDSLIALPPIQEQRRIVAKCNKFEEPINKYESIEQNLSQYENTFEDKLKASILQYAIEGKLVKQDPNDEPASKLLERIKEEKERLVKEGKIKREKGETAPIKTDDKNYYENLPINWSQTTLKEISKLISRGKTPKYTQDVQIPVLAQKCNQWDGIHIERCLYTSYENLKKYGANFLLKAGDIVINSTGGGTVGRTGIINQAVFLKFKLIVWDTHITVIRLSSLVDAKFVFYFLISPYVQQNIESKCEGSTNQIELYPKTICNFRLPLPPRREQERIVSRIETLFSQL